LVAGLISSGVAVHASTPGPDATYNALLSTYQASSQDVCYSNGTYITPANPCLISQSPSLTGQNNIAVCVQVTSAAQQCDISQGNIGGNNYALVVQRIHQQGTTASCPIPTGTTPYCQNGTQRASILQTDGRGSNFGGLFQKVGQYLTEQANDGDPGQNNEQDVQSLAVPAVPGLSQSSIGGSNYAAVGQDSWQYQAGSTAQTQNARQFVGTSGSERGINQTTVAPGGNAAVLGQLQRQNVQSQVALSQTEKAYQDGDITQNGGASNFQNFASGNQFQDQQELGVVGTLSGTGTHQVQIGDPKCCSTLFAGGVLTLVQATNEFANNAASRQQTETIVGNCIAPPSGCTFRQSATLNGKTTPGDPCNAQASCQRAIVCYSGEGGCFTSSGGIGAVVFSRPNLALRGRAVASAALLT
jgi:hypothetical protein